MAKIELDYIERIICTSIKLLWPFGIRILCHGAWKSRSAFRKQFARHHKALVSGVLHIIAI